MDYRVGFDIGGTFTDFFAVEVGSGEIIQEKVPTEQSRLSAGIRDGLTKTFDAHDVAPGDVTHVSHGTTIATNAMLERDGSKTGLVTTEGFRDIVAIGREKRSNIYDLSPTKTPTFTERTDRYGIDERIAADGEVLVPLDEEEVEAVAAELAASDVESVAVSLLHAYRNDAHERAVKRVFERETELAVSLSSEVMPEIQEYERTLSTVVDAYIGPSVDEYLEDVERMIEEIGIGEPLHVMQANGGVITPRNLGNRTLQLINSGPAAGVLGAKQYARESGIDDIIVLDMGGTSADTCVVRGGEMETTTEGKINDIPLFFPQIDVRTVGAGGGSVAWLDRADVLKVGPKSAGAYPGPACYGRGGEDPTVTDAALQLGYLDPEYFLGGEMTLDEAAAERALTSVGDGIGLDPTELSNGILDIVTTNMTRAIRLVTIEKGYDPREFALTLYGGAGPMFATRLARNLDIGRALVPKAPGVLSASGLLAADRQFDFSRSEPLTIDPTDRGSVAVDRVRSILAELEARGAEVVGGRVPTIRTVDVRYEGQTATLNVEMPDGEVDRETLDDVRRRFDEKYETVYGHSNPDERVEAVTWRHRVVEETPALEWSDSAAGDDVADAVKGTRTAYADGEFREFTVYDRYAVPFGSTFEGPAIVEEAESTTVIGPDSTVSVDDVGNLLVDVGT